MHNVDVNASKSAKQTVHSYPSHEDKKRVLVSTPWTGEWCIETELVALRSNQTHRLVSFHTRSLPSRRSRRSCVHKFVNSARHNGAIEPASRPAASPRDLHSPFGHLNKSNSSHCPLSLPTRFMIPTERYLSYRVSVYLSHENFHFFFLMLNFIFIFYFYFFFATSNVA